MAARRIPDAAPVIQRELLALLGRLGSPPSDFSAQDYLDNADPLVRREAVRLLLRNAAARETTIMRALADPDDRLCRGPHRRAERCPHSALDLTDSGRAWCWLHTPHHGDPHRGAGSDAATLAWCSALS